MNNTADNARDLDANMKHDQDKIDSVQLHWLYINRLRDQVTEPVRNLEYCIKITEYFQNGLISRRRILIFRSSE